MNDFSEIASLREKLRILVRDHSNYKRWQTRYQNALKIKADGSEQKRPTEYFMTEDYRDRLTIWLVQCEAKLKEVEKYIAQIVRQLPVWVEYFGGIKGIGELTIGYLEAYVDLVKASNEESLVVISKVWRFCGYGDADDRKRERGKKRNFCLPLKTQLYTTGMSLEKSRNGIGHKYGKIYDDTKHRYENSDREVEEIQKGGAKKTVIWKEAQKGHRRDAAIRKMLKEVIKDYVLERAALENRKVRPSYGEEYLGKKHSE